MPSNPTLRANGKLLLSGEYAVLDGALALALPTCFGQELEVLEVPGTPGLLYWESMDEQGKPWFSAAFHTADWSCAEGVPSETVQWMERLGRAVQAMKPDWLQGAPALQVRTRLDFPRDWGLGSSSTLVSLLAQWAGVNPYALLAASFGGSGYDIACAQAAGPLLFQRRAGVPTHVEVPFNPVFRGQLFFLYLGKKQNSREGIARYRALGAGTQALVEEISALTWGLATAVELDLFEALLTRHEERIASALQLTPVGERLFPDYWGKVKSLGAWGGDFVLLSSQRPEAETRNYFLEKGFSTLIPYDTLILNPYAPCLPNGTTAG